MLNLIKLCVGASSVADLEQWIAMRMAERARKGEALESIHTTRMVPSRRAALLDGGSLYWVIKGQIACRQKLIDIRPFIDDEGIKRCHLVMEPKLVQLRIRPRGPFQGWRYLEKKDAPPDLDQEGGGELPAEMQQELASLGLL